VAIHKNPSEVCARVFTIAGAPCLGLIEVREYSVMSSSRGVAAPALAIRAVTTQRA
jgi:hypothetical protein